MDWARAIERNTEALVRIVAGLFAMLGLEPGGILEKPPKAVYWAAVRLLRPVEAAVRRLIVVAARDLVLKPLPVRPMPMSIARGARKGAGRISFRLFDPRKRFFLGPRPRYGRAAPRIWFGGPEPVPLTYFRPPPAGAAPEPEPKPDTSHLSLGRRLTAVKMALDDIPRQAVRLLRRQMRLRAKTPLKDVSPMRPGQPPGHRKVPKDEIDDILKECHWLAFEARRPNTS